MAIYVSMLGIVCLGKILHEISISNHGVGRQTPVHVIGVLFVFGYIIFWVGIRDAFADTPAYIRAFNAVTIQDLHYLDFTPGSPWGFELIQILFKTFVSSNYHAWLMFIAIISGTCLAVTFRRYSPNFYYSVFLFVAATTFTWMMNGIRQFMAVCILFACTPLLEKKKGWQYCIVALLCTTIHATSVMMIPVYFLVQGKPWKKKTILLIAGVILVLVFTSQFTSLLDKLLADTTYSNAVDHFAGDDGVNPLRLLVFSVPTVLAFCCRDILRHEENELIDMFVNMSILTSAIYAIGMVTSGILIGRLPIYTQLYQYILLPIVFDKCFTRGSRRLLYGLSIVCFLFYFYLMTRGIYYSSEITGRIF